MPDSLKKVQPGDPPSLKLPPLPPMKSEESRQSSRDLHLLIPKASTLDSPGVFLTRRDVRFVSRSGCVYGCRKNAGSDRQLQRASWISISSTLKIAQNASPRTYRELPFQEPMKILWR